MVYSESHDVAIKGGRMVGESLKGYEARTGLKVVSSDNFLGLTGGNKLNELPEEDKTE